MDKGAANPGVRIWERVLEVVFVVAVVAGITIWVIINHRNETPAAPAKTAPLNVVSTAPLKLSLTYYVNGVHDITNIVSAPPDGRLFVTEHAGRILIIKDDVLQDQPLLDIHGKVKNDGEMGLIGLAFDPSFATNRYFYVTYSDIRDTSTVVSRFTADSQLTAADPATEKVLLRQPQIYPNHKGGQLAFGSDGYLYIGLGDGGSAGDPQDNAQNLGTWLGKILRIDVHKGDPYAVPVDNPFVKTAGAKPEIWDYGLRNPWRFSFVRTNHQLVIADVGQDKSEEIDVEAAGKGGNNYGWRCVEGDQSYNPANCKPVDSYVAPRFTYTHDNERCSITGGFVYEGNRLATFVGRYIYGDYCTGEIWSVDYTDKAAKPTLEASTHFKISTFGEGKDGSLYVADYDDGVIYKLSATI